MKVKLILLFLTLSIYSCADADHAGPRKQYSALRINELNSYLENIRKALLLPGISLVVIHGDSVYCRATGIADTQQRPLTPALPFSAGSISEPMLATAVMKLVADRTISLDDPVAKYLPYFKMSGKANRTVTIRHLLSHTSGIQKYNVMWDQPNNTPGALEVTTRSIANQQPKFPVPGSRVSRSPYNYDILADLVSKVTGSRFEDYLKKALFEPLAMRSSSFDQPGVTAMPFSVNNWLSYTTAQDSLYPYNRENGGSNGLHSSPADIASWMYMLLNHGKTDKDSFVPENIFTDFFSPQYHTNKQSSIGFGWDIIQSDGENVYTKISKITSFSSQVTLIPGTKTGVAVFSNIGYADTEEITRNLILWLKGGRLPHPKIPVSIPMGRKLAATHSLDSAFRTYIILKQQHSRQYDLSEDALNSFGLGLLRHLQDKEKAIDVFRFCIQQNPLSAKGYLNLAETYAAIGDFSSARNALERSRPFQSSRDWSHSSDIEKYMAEQLADPDPG